MVGEVEFDCAVGVASDVGTGVFGCLVVPYKLAVAFSECGFEQLYDGMVSGEDLSVVDVH